MKVKKLFGGVSLIMFIVTNLHAQNYDSIKAELEKDYFIMTTLRESIWPTFKKYGIRSRQVDSLNSLIQKFDQRTLDQTTFIIDQYGWLGKSQIGADANAALFLIVQNAKENKIREKYYPLLEKSAMLKESNLPDMASMKDKILVGNGKKQLYGTHRTLGGKLYPVEDPRHLNDRREQVWLRRLSRKEMK